MKQWKQCVLLLNREYNCVVWTTNLQYARLVLFSSENRLCALFYCFVMMETVSFVPTQWSAKYKTNKEPLSSSFLAYNGGNSVCIGAGIVGNTACEKQVNFAIYTDGIHQNDTTCIS